jgi:signal transduction histidine kinase
VATHGLRDRIARSQQERDRLPERFTESTVREDRDRIAAELRDKVVQQIFAAGLTLQGVADRMTDAGARRRVQAAVEELDEAVQMIRDAVCGSSIP